MNRVTVRQKRNRQTSHTRSAALLACGLFAAPVLANAQVSLSTAVDLALHNSPRVRMAQADVAKAQASLSEARDVFIPAVTAGAGLGNSYGYSPNPPTLFAFNATSLIYGASQSSLIRSGRFGITASDFALTDARQAVAEDGALSYLALHHDQQREVILAEENERAQHLVQIEQDRFDAGRDSSIDLTTAKLTAARFRLARLNAEDETAHDRDHLARLLGLPATTPLQADADFPDPPVPVAPVQQPENQPATPGIASAYANAEAKQQVAIGDSRYLYRPQLSLIVQYNRYATFTDSFTQLQSINSGLKIGANEGVFAVQVTVPFYDKAHQAKARESLADAQHARAEADNAQHTALDGQFKLRHSIALLQARTEVAQLDQQLAQQQLDALSAQLNAPAAAGGPLSTPKDEQNARLSEREKYLALIDAKYQLQQTQINLLRQSGQLESWLQHLASTPASLTPTQP